MCSPSYQPPSSPDYLWLWPVVWGVLAATLVVVALVRWAGAAHRSVEARGSDARQRRVMTGFGMLVCAWVAMLAAPVPGDLRVRAIAVGLAALGAVLALLPVARYAGALRAIRSGRGHAGALLRVGAGLAFTSDELRCEIDVRGADRIGFRAAGDDDGPCVLVVRDASPAVARRAAGPFRSDSPAVLPTARVLIAGTRAEAIAELRARALDAASRAFWITVAFTVVAVISVDENL